MHGSLDPDENVMEDGLRRNKAAASVNQGVVKKLYEVIAQLEWDILFDDIAVEIGGTAVSGIEQPEGYNEKWSSPKGHRKYNKDAFIVIKNKTRNPWTPSKAPVEDNNE